MMTAPDLARTSGLTYREIDYWTRRGVLVPTHPATGSGTYRGYDDSEARVLWVLAALRRYGFGLDALTEVAATLREWPESEWAGPLFIDDTGRVFREPRSGCWWLDLSLLEQVPA